MRLASSFVDVVSRCPAHGREPRCHPSTRPRRRDSAAARSSSRRRGCAARSRAVRARPSGEHAARIGSAPFLLPDARRRPLSGRPPSITNDSATGLASVVGHGRIYASHGLGDDPFRGVGDADALHEERGAAAPRARRRGVDGLVRRAGTARTRSCGAWPRCSTTSTTRSTRRSTSIRRTERRSCAKRATRRWSSTTVLSHANHLELPRDTPLQAHALRLRRAVGVRPCVRARPADGARRARAEVRASKKLKQPSFAVGRLA